MEDTKKDKKTLKAYFQSGKVPTEAQFADLIESIPNIAEDGHLKAGEKGWIICPVKGTEPGVAFYLKEPGDNCDEHPAWLLTATSDGDLLLKNERAETLLSVSQDMTFTLSGQLNVKGNVTADSLRSRSGSVPGTIVQDIPANKKWHDLPVEAAIQESRPGCRVYRIWVCYEDAALECYETTEALAQQSSYNHLKIGSSRKHWWGWSGKIRLRWKQLDGKPYLQIRSKNKNIKGSIHCQIAETWNYTETKE